MRRDPRTGRRRFLREAIALVLGSAVFPPGRAFGVRPSPAAGRLAGEAAADLGLVEIERYCDTMGSVATIRVYAEDGAAGLRAVRAAFAEMQNIDALMSAYDPRSVISALNRQAGREEVAVPPPVMRALELAGDFHALTGGAFDVTVGPLMSLFGLFGDGSSRPYPTDRMIAETLARVGHRNLVIDRNAGTAALTRTGSMIDLGGIGVGLAVDRAAAALRSHGIESALIDHSGDILAVGSPPGSGGWEVGIRDPMDPRGVVHTLRLSDRAVSTSGNYERFADFGDRRVGHILDPVTGLSASGYLSVSVASGSATEADALSTGVFAGGQTEGMPAGENREFIIVAPDERGSGTPCVRLK